MEDQPAAKIGKTENLLTAIKKNKPNSKLKPPKIVGTTPHKTKTKNKDIKGIKKNNLLFPTRGNVYSFKNNFTASEKGCRSPQKPTFEGPNRICKPPSTFCSIKVTKATVIKTRTIIIK